MNYLGIKIDKNWCHQINNLVAKLNRANPVSTLRHFVYFSTIKSIYYAIYQTHLNYSLVVLAQNVNVN